MSDNISKFPIRPKKRDSAPLTIAERGYRGCQHKHVEIDEQLAEVTCTDCKERLNPMKVLVMLANEDWRLRDRLSAYRARIEKLKTKGRCKCQHCGKLTEIPATVSDAQIDMRRHELRNAEDKP